MATIKVAAPAPATPGSRNWLALILGIIVGFCVWAAVAPESGLCTMPDGKVVSIASLRHAQDDALAGAGASSSVQLLSGDAGGAEVLGDEKRRPPKPPRTARKVLQADAAADDDAPAPVAGSGESAVRQRLRSPIRPSPYWVHGPVEEVPIPANIPSVTLPEDVGPDDPLDAVIWYPPECEVERHFVLKELMPGALKGGKLTVRTLYPRTLTSFRRHDAFAVINDTETPNVVVFHGMIEDMQKCDSAIPEKAQYYKPAFTFLLSDEQGASWCGNQRLADMAPMTLRQYAPPQHPMGVRHSMLTLPLGYNGPDGFIPRANQTVASKRSLTWAWAGAVRNDRTEMLTVLEKAFPTNDVARNKNLPRAKMIPMYLKSKFVPNARGQVSHDCFRLYEASKSGAIPVVTGPKGRVFDTFGHFVGWEGQLPPWLYVERWSDAPAAMKPLLRSPAQLDAKQQDVLDWWDRTVAATKATIRRALEVDVLYRRSVKAAVEAWRGKGGDVAEAVANALEYAPRPTMGTRDEEFAAAPPKPPATVRRPPIGPMRMTRPPS